MIKTNHLENQGISPDGLKPGKLGEVLIRFEINIIKIYKFIRVNVRSYNADMLIITPIYGEMTAITHNDDDHYKLGLG